MEVGTTTEPAAFAGQVVKAILGRDEFVVSEEGIYHAEIEGERITPVTLVCAPLRIIADTRDAEGENWGRILQFNDKDGKAQRYVMKMQELKRDGEDIIEALLARGLSIAPGKKARLRLVEYIHNSQPENNARARSTDITGWYGNRFILANCVIGEGDEQVMYQGRQPEPRAYEQEGTLEEWADNVARLCVGNSRLVLAVGAALAAPLLRMMRMESGGFHFVGNSSTGKSTALYVAASVMGRPPQYIQSWRATSNGLEGIAKFHNDTCLMLDELSQVQPREAGEIAYMLANGSGKLRANIKGDARQKASWQLLFLSSGEVTLGEHMDEGGKKVKAGMEIRLVDIHADAGKGLGIFENIHGYSNGAEFSDALKRNSTLYYGSAFRAFLELAINEGEKLRPIIATLQNEFMNQLTDHENVGQVGRVAARLGLIAAAGEMATRYGLTKWPEGEAMDAALTCLRSWLDLRGGTEQQESKAVLDQVSGYLEQYGDSRFVRVSYSPGTGYTLLNPLYQVSNRSGFRYEHEDKTMFIVLPQGFRDMCKGFNIKSAAKILVEKGVITPGNDGKSQKSFRLPMMGTKKAYHINTNIWDSEGSDKNATGPEDTEDTGDTEM